MRPKQQEHRMQLQGSPLGGRVRAVWQPQEGNKMAGQGQRMERSQDPRGAAPVFGTPAIFGGGTRC